MIRSCGALLQKPHNILSARHVAKQLSESEEITYRTMMGERLIIWRGRNYTHRSGALRLYRYISKRASGISPDARLSL